MRVPAQLKLLPLLLVLFGSLLGAGGCDDSSTSPPPAAGVKSEPERSPAAGSTTSATDDSIRSIRSRLGTIEGHLKTSTAENWTTKAAAARNSLGGIRSALGQFKQGSQQGRRGVELWLGSLEGALASPTAENWSRNASAAKKMVGEIRYELQTLERENSTGGK